MGTGSHAVGYWSSLKNCWVFLQWFVSNWVNGLPCWTNLTAKSMKWINL